MLKIFAIFAFTHLHAFFQIFKNITHLGFGTFAISLLILDFKALKSGRFFSYTRPFNIPQRKKSGGIKSGLRPGDLGLDISWVLNTSSSTSLVRFAVWHVAPSCCNHPVTFSSDVSFLKNGFSNCFLLLWSLLNVHIEVHRARFPSPQIC